MVVMDHSRSPFTRDSVAFLSSVFIPHTSVIRCVESSFSSVPLMHARPMRGTRVVFTAPYVYAPRLGAALLEAEARPLHMPTIETAPLPDCERSALEDAVLRLCDYDLVAFPSRTAIQSFASALRRIVANDASAASIALRASGVRLAALGADALAVKQELGMAPDIVPPSATPGALAELIAADPDWRNARILVPVPVVRHMKEPSVISDFLIALRKACGVLSAVPAYLTTPTDPDSLAVELQLLNNLSIDAVVISSIAEALALHALLSREQLDRFVGNIQSGSVFLAVHGPVTAKGVADVFGVEPIVSKDWSSFAGVVDALERAFIDRFKNAGKLFIATGF